MRRIHEIDVVLADFMRRCTSNSAFACNLAPHALCEEKSIKVREMKGTAHGPRHDLKEDLIHSLQKHVEVDEPEAAAPAQIASSSEDVAEGIAEAAEEDVVAFDRMSEEELLAGIEGLVAPEKNDDF